jgi:hypothetical protein
VLGYACYASDSNVSRILHYCLPHSRGLSGETSSTPVSKRAQSLAETPSHPVYLVSYWSICLGSQLIMAQSSQRIDTVKLMHSGRVLPPLQAQVSTPQSWRVGPYPRLCSCRFKKPNLPYHITPAYFRTTRCIAQRKRSGQKPPCIRQQKVDSSGIEPETLHMLSVRSAN